MSVTRARNASSPSPRLCEGLFPGDDSVELLPWDVLRLEYTSEVQRPDTKAHQDAIYPSNNSKRKPKTRLQRWSKYPFARRLHAEIQEFVNFVAPSKGAQTSRSEAVERFRECILQVFPRAEVRVFGSFSTGMFLPTSDIDLTVNSESLPPARNSVHILA
ncbi:MAG: hypothetical protein MHM6MM_003090, partial [Cercozoa sp. M6MM]